MLLFNARIQCTEKEREKKRLKNSKFREAKEIDVCVCVCDEEKTRGRNRGKKKMRNRVGGWGARMERRRICGELGYRSTLSRDPRFIVNTNELQVDRARALIEKVGRR